MEFKNILKKLRLEKSMSQTELASKLQTTQDTISLWECGKSYPDVKLLIKLAKFFDVTTDYLLGLADF